MSLFLTSRLAVFVAAAETFLRGYVPTRTHLIFLIYLLSLTGYMTNMMLSKKFRFVIRAQRFRLLLISSHRHVCERVCVRSATNTHRLSAGDEGNASGEKLGLIFGNCPGFHLPGFNAASHRKRLMGE